MLESSVELFTSRGVLSVSLYDNAVAHSFLRLVRSGQLNGVSLDRLVPGCFTLCQVERAVGIVPCTLPALGARQSHTGAGLLSSPSLPGGVPGSRFLITLSPQPGLDSVCVVFGRVKSGLRILKDLQESQINESFQLVTPVIIEKGVVVDEAAIYN